MRHEAIFTNWDETSSALWGHQPMRLEHRLHRSALFSREALASLVEAYPRSHYSLVSMGAPGQRRSWREGEIGGVSGEGVIRAIEAGRLWLNLRNVDTVDARYRAVLDEMFAELAERVPGFEPATYTCGILISSPSAQVYYHADLPGQHLWQIIGRKRVHVYPNTAPFLTPRHLEDIALFDNEFDIPYAPWYDDHAKVLDLAPGQMLSWPLNAPHRVENLDCLNVSMTISFFDETIRRTQMVNIANGLLRHRFGRTATSRSIAGPVFAAKRAMQKVMRDTGWVKTQRSARRPVDFRLDPESLGQIRDLDGRRPEPALAQAA